MSGLRSDNPQAYLPGDRRRALAAGHALPDRINGAALFADISGFTPLTGALTAELGPRRGAEELTLALDAVFGPLLGELERHGGDVIYFSGDAITAWLDGDDGMVAVACGLAMQRVMTEVGLRSTPTGRSFRLGLKVAVAAGDARRFVVGDPDVQLIDVLAGALMDRLADSEHAARQGEVLVDAATAARVGDRLVLGEARENGAARAVLGVASPVVLPQLRPPPPVLPDETVRQWLLPQVYERMSTGQGEFLAELRPCVPLFLSFEGIDYDADPDATGRLDGVVTRAQRVVAANGGNVLQLTIGDKGAYLYAVFGAPVAHEDDAARACSSALELLRLTADTAARNVKIGIAAGSLRSGTYGHDDRRTFACLGDATNLAARLMSAAPAGTAYATEQVRRAGGGSFDWSGPVELRVKGKSSGVLAATLLADRGTPGGSAAPEPGGVADVVGRDAELAVLREIAELAMRGQGQVAVITGPAGVGKSTVLAEMSGWLAGHGVRVRAGAPRAYGARTPYAVWQDISREAWGIPPDATPAEVITLLEALLADVDPGLLSRLPLVGPLVGMSIPDTSLTATFDAKLRKTSLEALVIDVIEASAANGPLAYLINAAEHLDELSRDLLEAVCRASARLPVLVLVAERAPAAGAPPTLPELPNLHTVQLANLDGAASRALVRGKLRGHTTQELPGSVLDRIIALADGNPLYLDELVNHLIDRGVDAADSLSHTELPASLHSLQLTRIDGLPDAPRRTLKVASVAGMRFDVPTVAGVYPELGPEPEVGAHTRTLAGAALVVPEDGEDAYAFRHVTTQQVAYETLPFATRSLLHDRFLSWLEEHNRAGYEAILDLLVYHARNGSDTAKLRDYLVRAGIAAQARYANEAAVEYFTAAVPLVDPAERAAIQRRLGKVLEILGRWAQAEQSYRQAIELCEQLSDDRGGAHARTDLAEVARKQSRFEQAAGLLRLADESFARLDDRDGQATVLHLRGTLAAQQSHFDEARASYAASLQIRRELDDKPKIGALLSNLAVVAEQEGDYGSARELNEQALVVRSEVGDRWAIAVSNNNLGMIALLQHEYGRATAHIEASIQLATEVGDRWIVAVGQHNHGIALRGLTRYAESGQAFVAALQAYLDYGDRWSLVQLIEDVAFLAVETGLDAAAFELVGAADSLRTDLDAPRPPAPAERLDEALAPLRARLGAEAGRALDAGRRRPDSAAIELVRSVCLRAGSIGSTTEGDSRTMSDGGES